MEFICIIEIVPSYLGNWGKRVNFGNGVAEIQQKYEREREKVGERKRKSGREKILNFGNHINEIPVAQTYWPKTNCGNTIAEIGKKKFCGNAIAENGKKKKKNFPLLFRQCHCHIPLFFFFFFIEKICAHNFYNTFITSFKWQIVIVGLKSNLSVKFKFELIITSHLWFVVKML